MFNLLTQTNKDKIKSEYQRRRLVVLLVLVALELGIGILALVPSHLISWYKHKEIVHTQALLKGNIAIKSRDNLNTVIAIANTKIKSLYEGRNQSMAIVVADIVERKDENIVLDSFTFGYNDKKKVTITIGGIARNRESLLAFAEHLKENTSYAQVDLPISNFTKESNIDFTLNIIGT